MRRLQFIERASVGLSEAELDKLAAFEMNGRDIKHAVRTAQAVALVGGERMGMGHLEEVLAVAKSGFAMSKQ